MKAVVAIDSFKGSLSSSQAGKAAADGIIRVYPDAKVEICVLADGGEGTMEALMSGIIILLSKKGMVKNMEKTNVFLLQIH